MLNKVLLGVFGLLVVALVMQYQYVRHLKEMVAIERDALEKAQESRDAWHERTMATLEQLNDARRRSRAAEEAVAALQETLAERDARYDDLRRRIQNAPAEDDGAVAPVLRDTLGRLP